MTEMVERVARALEHRIASHAYDCDAVDMDELARVAIAAMPEPTEAMLAAARALQIPVTDEGLREIFRVWWPMTKAKTEEPE